MFCSLYQKRKGSSSRVINVKFHGYTVTGMTDAFTEVNKKPILNNFTQKPRQFNKNLNLPHKIDLSADQYQ